jgi:hypothetical protein
VRYSGRTKKNREYEMETPSPISIIKGDTLLGPGGFFSFVILYTVGRTPWTGDQPVARPLPKHRTTQTQNKRTQTTIPRMGFEPTTIEFEQAKTGHTLDRAATVIGCLTIPLLEVYYEMYTIAFLKTTTQKLTYQNYIYRID